MCHLQAKRHHKTTNLLSEDDEELEMGWSQIRRKHRGVT